MANETLSVPEENLSQVIRVIRAGVQLFDGTPHLDREVRDKLTKWCNEEEQYLRSLEDDS